MHIDDAARVTVALNRDSWDMTRCSVARALGVVGTRSAMLIMREAFYGARRFDEFARRVGVTDAVAAERLRELVSAGLLEKRPYKEPGQRTREEYRLTEMGRELFPAIIALMQWGDRWLAGEQGPPLEVRHADCGELVHAEVRCAAGHAVERPGGVIMQAVRAASSRR
jgi:DNA-binding HxlR family transcriptional regulator